MRLKIGGAVRAQVHSRQMPSSFCRNQTRSPRCPTAFQNIAPSVSPGTNGVTGAGTAGAAPAGAGGRDAAERRLHRIDTLTLG